MEIKTNIKTEGVPFDLVEGISAEDCIDALLKASEQCEFLAFKYKYWAKKFRDEICPDKKLPKECEIYDSVQIPN